MSDKKLTPISLGSITLPSNVMLAPMAGITDLPFRKIIREFGDFLMFSEMIASNAVIRHVARSYKMIEGAEDSYTSVQIVGADPKIMADAAKLSYDLGAKLLDINMGCPVKKIVKSEAGSALMKNEILAKKIIESVVKAVPIPVSLKIRLGWDCTNLNSPTIAKIAEDCGVSMITVHGRTRSQLYSGTANWKAIQNVKNAVSKTPVIANGDIVDIESAEKCLKESGADGIMIGRGSLGSPWIMRQIHDHLDNSKNPYNQSFDIAKKYDIAKKHISYMLDFYDEERATLLCRKVLMYYCKGISNASSFRRQITSVSSIESVYSLLDEMFLSKEQE